MQGGTIRMNNIILEYIFYVPFILAFILIGVLIYVCLYYKKILQEAYNLDNNLKELSKFSKNNAPERYKIFKDKNTPNLKNGRDVKFEIGDKVTYKALNGEVYDNVIIDSEYAQNQKRFGYEALFEDGRFFISAEGIIDWEGKN